MKQSHSKLIFTALLTYALIFPANAQQNARREKVDMPTETKDLVKVRGVVTAFHTYSVNKAEITARKTRSKTSTDTLGRFEIMAAAGDILVFKVNGFEKNRREVTTNGDDLSVNMILVPGKKNHNAAVTNGHISHLELQNALDHYMDFNNDYVKHADIRDLLKRELYEATVVDHGSIRVYLIDDRRLTRADMAGRRPSDNEGTKSFYMGGGDSGSDPESLTQVYIGDGNTIPSGIVGNPRPAIFVLDGNIVPNIDFLHPWEVKSVKLLKGMGAMRYGSRGENGVVLIQTKHY